MRFVDFSLLARPCCTGILGDCVLTSREDCRRRRGIFHPRAHLCSQVREENSNNKKEKKRYFVQVDCIQSVCGMLEFFVGKLTDLRSNIISLNFYSFEVRVPDQVYRFWTVIFIHAG